MAPASLYSEMSTPIHCLLACTGAEGFRSATKLPGWQKWEVANGSKCMTNAEGERVNVMSSTDRLRGLCGESTIYLGPHWLHAHGDSRAAVQAHRDRGGKVIEIVNNKEVLIGPEVKL